MVGEVMNRCILVVEEAVSSVAEVVVNYSSKAMVMVVVVSK